MKERLKLFGIYSLFWIGYFVLARILFLLYQNELSFELGFTEWVLVFVHGFRMDLSSAGYIMALVGLLLVFTSFSNGKWIHRFLYPLNIVFLILTSIIVVADLELYENWGFRMDATPLLYITKPKEAMASTEWWLTLILIFMMIALVLSGIYIYNRLIKQQVLRIGKSKIYAPLLLLLLTGSMILPVRGGISVAPMNTGMVYFSHIKFANHAAINVVWNVMHSVVYINRMKVTNKFMETDKANKIVQNLNKQSGSTQKVITNQRPNVLLLILESFSTKVVTSLGGQWDAAPNFNRLAREELTFTNFYANGDRSDKGLVSIISGYPAQPTTSIIKEHSKTESLPSLFDVFNKLDYKTSFYYGGDMNFANMNSYFHNAEVQYIISDRNFNAKLRNSKWGVHDEHLFKKLYEDLVLEDSLFFNVVFTLSSHDPFDVPMDPVFVGNDRGTKYLNSVYYTDSCLIDFIEKFKKTDLWNNTLVILVADHGSRRPGKSRNHEISKFHIPMIWMGGVVSDSIKKVHTVGSQIDIPATLFGQLEVPSDQFIYSKDLLKEQKSEFAYYVFNDGFAFITDSSKVIYDNVGSQIILKEGNIDHDLLNGKALLQVITDDYQNR